MKSQIRESNNVEELQDQVEFLEKLLLASYGPDWVNMSQYDCAQKRKQLAKLNDLQTS